MGAIFRPKDLSNRYRKIISNDAVKDLFPDTKESTRDIQDKVNEGGPKRTHFDNDLGKREQKKNQSNK
jgi:hypothetical protein